MIITAWHLWSLLFRRQGFAATELEDQNGESKEKRKTGKGVKVNIETSSLMSGGPRVKFRALWKGSFEDFFQIHSEARTEYESLCRQLSRQLLMLEELGAAPVMPDNKVAGNAGALLTIDNHDYLVCSKSGKYAKTAIETYRDFTIVESFNADNWSCEYFSKSEDIVPTSDAPLHVTALGACEKLNWERKPKFLLHGHAFETEAEAQRLKFPISTEETLFSTKEDSEALFTLLTNNSFPDNKIFIRKEHGFVLLGEDANDALKTFEKSMKPFL